MKRPSAGSCSFAWVVGPTKSGITKSSRSSLVSRTSERSAPLERSRRSRVAGKALTREIYASGTAPAGSGGSSSTSTGTGPPPVHGSSSTAAEKYSHIARRIASSGSTTSTPRSP